MRRPEAFEMLFAFSLAGAIQKYGNTPSIVNAAKESALAALPVFMAEIERLQKEEDAAREAKHGGAKLPVDPHPCPGG